VRTGREIAREHVAIKALRGDFEHVGAQVRDQPGEGAPGHDRLRAILAAVDA